MKKNPIAPAAMDQLFLSARTFNAWDEAALDDKLIHDLYDVLKWGPTSANSCPARFVWVKSKEGRAQLAALAMDANKAKILEAPLTVIIGNDLDFPTALPKLLPAAMVERMQKMFSAPGAAEVSAMRNGSLQGAYLILAARAIGLDCGPMSGFDNAGVDKAFFAGTRIQSNFICCLGYGKEGAIHPRAPRLSFDEAGRFA